MARKRHQHPTPFKEGNWWWIYIWQDQFSEGKLVRKRKRIRLCEAAASKRLALERADEELHKVNSFTVGSATQFAAYVQTTYNPIEIPLLASTTQASYGATLRKHLLPLLARMPLRDLNTLTVQKYFSALAASKLSAETVAKIKEVLSAVLGSAVRYGFLPRNPLHDVKIPRSKTVNRRKRKPHITPDEFQRLVMLLDEPYATMISTAVFSGLRVSELIGLRWDDVHDDSLTIDERYCRGDWSITKTVDSSTTIGVHPSVIARIRQLKTLEVQINWGGKGAKKRIKLVRSDDPQGSCLPVTANWRSHARWQCLTPSPAAGSAQAGHGSQESNVASPADVLRHMDDPSGRQSQRCTGPNAPFPHWYHHGNLRAIRA